ncbi:MAG: 3-hydroxyacyl-ACP dehydratase FabZ [Rickettsiales bacterium]|jgi:3-hydroxyacyl-[acyl-carrier-protein] dehydratase|nr:3-hydroxyacyl-ACP dehydratase FabZ [Rickettsiales bacterium]
MQESDTIDIVEIMNLIPHRYPFLLVDRVTNFVKNNSCTGIKNLTFNENFFQGHFAGNPIMPGVLIIEAMAQTASVLIAKSIGRSVRDGELILFTTIDGAKFRKSVVPGDQLELHIRVINHKMGAWFCEGTGVVLGQKVAEAKFSAMVVGGQTR